jgi:hypothetical protein
MKQPTKGNKMKAKSKKIYVLITTDEQKRGVFKAKIDPADADKIDIPAEEVQMCVKWSEEVRGVLGLAANGPTKHCRITPVFEGHGVIKGVTLVLQMSDKAVKAWKSCPWG